MHGHAVFCIERLLVPDVAHRCTGSTKVQNVAVLNWQVMRGRLHHVVEVDDVSTARAVLGRIWEQRMKLLLLFEPHRLKLAKLSLLRFAFRSGNFCIYAASEAQTRHLLACMCWLDAG